jgi:hypothetical protein
MLPRLTVQQRTARCGCGRYLAWWTLTHPACCGCMDPPETCTCTPTSDPAEGCFSAYLQHAAEPVGEDLECE